MEGKMAKPVPLKVREMKSVEPALREIPNHERKLIKKYAKDEETAPRVERRPPPEKLDIECEFCHKTEKVVFNEIINSSGYAHICKKCKRKR